MHQLRRKRKRVFWGILAVVVSNFIIMAAPLVGREVEKNIFLTFANIVMFVITWDAYFEDKLSQKSPWGIIKDLIAVTAVGAITAFITYSIITKTIARLIITWGSLGWIAAGAISGLATMMLGLIWAFYCDDLYRNSAT